MLRPAFSLAAVPPGRGDPGPQDVWHHPALLQVHVPADQTAGRGQVHQGLLPGDLQRAGEASYLEI